MNNNKNKIIAYLCVAAFAVAGVYFTFFAGDTKKYDSQTKAYQIEQNRRLDSDGATVYYPTYYFKVNGNNYECESKTGSSTVPDENKNIVYYDSNNPTKCMTEYEKSTGLVAGIICLIAAAVIIFIIKKGSSADINDEPYHNQTETVSLENQYQMDEQAQKAIGIIEKIQLIYKRVVIAIIILVLLIFTLIDTTVLNQTIKSKDYIEVTATYAYLQSEEEDGIFSNAVYTFKDKQGNLQEIIVNTTNESSPQDSIKVKYNENNPQDYYTEGQTLDKEGMIWYAVKVIAIVLLIALFFNKKLLSKVNISASSNNNRR